VRQDEVPAGYRDVALVGHGGFADVYRAEREGLGQIVALKVLRSDHLDDATRRQFERECRTLGRLSGNPHIVTPLEAGFTPQGRPFLAMTYVDGGTVAQRMTTGGSGLPVDEVVQVGILVANALSAAHDAGVLHRDVKPENILVSKAGHLWLSDFGIATMADAQGSVSGSGLTPWHVAPEVLNSDEASVSGDLYSLGSTLHTLLTGTPPFKRGSGENSIGMILKRTLYEEPPSITRDDIPLALADIVRSLLAKKPELRPRTASEVAQALTHVQSAYGYVPDAIKRNGAPSKSATAPATSDADEDHRTKVVKRATSGDSIDRMPTIAKPKQAVQEPTPSSAQRVPEPAVDTHDDGGRTVARLPSAQSASVRQAEEVSAPEADADQSRGVVPMVAVLTAIAAVLAVVIGVVVMSSGGDSGSGSSTTVAQTVTLPATTPTPTDVTVTAIDATTIEVSWEVAEVGGADEVSFTIVDGRGVELAADATSPATVAVTDASQACVVVEARRGSRVQESAQACAGG
jgi:serine/threonine-protein kinase PknK